MNMLGEYNIGGDGFEIEDLLERCGITLVATFSGNSTYDSVGTAHIADLNLVMCHRSINYMAEMMETKYRHAVDQGQLHRRGSHREVPAPHRAVLRRSELIDRVEKVIAEEMVEVSSAARGPIALRRQDGHAVRGRQPRAPLPGAVRGTGDEDRVGRLRVRPSRRLRGPQGAADIKVDADSRNIEELEVEPEERYSPRRNAARSSGSKPTACDGRVRGHDERDGRRQPRHRRYQPLRDREAPRHPEARPPVRGHQGEVRRAEAGIPSSSCTITISAAPMPASAARSISIERSTGS